MGVCVCVRVYGLCSRFVDSIWMVRYSVVCSEIVLVTGSLQLISAVIEKELIQDIGYHFNGFYTLIYLSFCASYFATSEPPDPFLVAVVSTFSLGYAGFLTYIALSVPSRSALYFFTCIVFSIG